MPHTVPAASAAFPAKSANAEHWNGHQPIKAYMPAQSHTSEPVPVTPAVMPQPATQKSVPAGAADTLSSEQQTKTAAQPACAEAAASQPIHQVPSSSSQGPSAHAANSEVAFGSIKAPSSSAARQGLLTAEREMPRGKNEAPSSSEAGQKTSISVTAQPELYNALCAAVNAVVQHAGLPSSQSNASSYQPGCTDACHASHAATAVGYSQKPSAAVDHHRHQQQQQQQQQTGQSADDSHQTGSGTVSAQLQTTADKYPHGSQAEGTEGSDTSGKGLNGVSSPGSLQAWQSHIQQAVAVLQSALQASQQPGNSSHQRNTAAALQSALQALQQPADATGHRTTAANAGAAGEVKAAATSGFSNSALAGEVHNREQQAAVPSNGSQRAQHDVQLSLAAQHSTGKAHSIQQGSRLNHSSSELQPPDRLHHNSNHLQPRKEGEEALVGSEDLQPEASWPQVWPLRPQHDMQGATQQHHMQGTMPQQQVQCATQQHHMQGRTPQHCMQGTMPQHHMQDQTPQQQMQDTVLQQQMQDTMPQHEGQGTMPQHHMQGRMPQHQMQSQTPPRQVQGIEHNQGQRRHVTAQRRLYKHGPMIPAKLSTGVQ